MTNLQKQIENLNEEMSHQLPHEVIEAFANSIAELKKSELESNCVQVGETISPFTLISDKGCSISSDNLFEQYDKLILAFFRGVWCPYCNLEMKALQDSLSDIGKHHAILLGISPQKTDYSKKMKLQNNANFDMLYDRDNAFAKSLGINFTLQKSVQPYYQSLNIDLKTYNGSDAYELPVPAVLVVDKTYTVRYAFVNVNYMNRIKISELMENL